MGVSSRTCVTTTLGDLEAPNLNNLTGEVNANEAASFDMHGTGDGIRVTVEGNCRGARVMAQIIDKDTGKVVDALDINDLF